MNKNNDINRRSFLKRMGGGAGVIALSSLAGCVPANKNADEEIPTDKMTYRKNPKTGEDVSILGYGMMRLPMSGPEDGEQTVDQEQVNQLVDYALEHGVNYFDTSPAYCRGQSEKATGIALSRHPRDSYFVATKLSNFAPSTWSRDSSMEMYRKSFEYLQVDTIDYMLLHAIGGGEDAMATFNGRYIDNGMLDFLVEEREKGKIRNLGFSYHGDIKIFDFLLENHDKYKWDFVQIQMNYLDWRFAKKNNESNTNAEYLYDELNKRNIPVVIMEPLLGGRLSNVPDNIVTRLKQRDPEKSVASWAFRFCGTYPKVLTALSGMTCMEHLQDNLRSFCPLEPLSNEDLDFLQTTAEMMMQYETIPCNNCKYCMPCPYGIDIPAILMHYNKCLNEGNIVADPGNSEYRKARRAYLVGYDRSVPKLRQASHCIACGRCKTHCPQNINIPAELHRIDNYVEQLKQNEG